MADALVDEIGEKWESEQIPDEDKLYMRVHRNHIDESGNVIPGHFKNHPKGSLDMSTDWCKYSTPDETRWRNARQSPENYKVIEMMVARIREIPGQSVKHSPDQYPPEGRIPNRAHTDVVGVKDVQVRILFTRIYEFCSLQDLP